MPSSATHSTWYWTIRAWCKPLALVCALGFTASVASAEIQTDPLALYGQMKKVYDRGAAAGWAYTNYLDYFAAVLDAGRAYSLRRPDDPNAAEIQALTIDLATSLHYDALLDENAAEWYVREAANAVIKSGDSERSPQAQTLLIKLAADDVDPKALARDADIDATAIVKQWPSDRDALIGQIDADLRAFALTHDPNYRALALGRAAQPTFPIGIVNGRTASELFTDARSAVAEVPGYTYEERIAGHAVISHRSATHIPIIIGKTIAMTHEARLVITAPADEYFGNAKLSPIGVGNEIIRIGKYLDVGWGDRMTADALRVSTALVDWQKQYPRDYALPRTILSAYKTIARIDSADAKSAAAQLKALLTVQYNTTDQAHTLLSS